MHTLLQGMLSTLLLILLCPQHCQGSKVKMIKGTKQNRQQRSHMDSSKRKEGPGLTWNGSQFPDLSLS